MVTNETAKTTYTITEGITEYAIGFAYKTNPDGSPQIKVCLNKHVESPLVYGVDYEITQDLLSVRLLAGYEVGDRIDIIRNIPMVQLSDYVVGRIDPEQIESDMDQAVLRDQQISSELSVLQEMPADHERRITTLEEEMDSVTGTVDSHIANTSNPHSVTKAQVGLGNVDNTSDINKPISTATQSALDLKANSADLATVATSGSYSDLLNKPTIPDAQIQSDWAQSDNTKIDYIKNKPSLATVATSGSYSDLSNTPTIPAAQVNSDWDAVSGVAQILNKPTIPSGLTDLSDVTISTPTSGQFLMYDGSKWANTSSTASISWGGITGTLSNQADLKSALDAKLDAHVFDYDSVTHADIENARNVSDAPIIIQHYNRLFMYSGSIYTTYYFYGFSGDHISLLTIQSGGTKTIVNYPQINNHVVIKSQEPTAQNNYTWYRKYADGWVEQGGYVAATSTSDDSKSVTLPVQMDNADYMVQTTVHRGIAGGSGMGWDYVSDASTSAPANTTTTLYISVASTSYCAGKYWEVKGLAAQS